MFEDSPHLSGMNHSDVFTDLLVVELSSVLAGPAVGMFFAELGARVVKVENKRTGGDVTRSWKLPQEGPNAPASAYYHSVNWHKETLFADLSEDKDRQQIMALIREADILITNFKAGSDKKLGLDPDSLKPLNPRLIFASINAYGANNPRAGFDAMIQAETGWIYMNGEPEGNPVKLPVALMDVLAAHQLKEGILVALFLREKTGNGSEVSVSLFDTGVASLANQAANWLNAGVLPQRQGSRHPNIAPYGDIFFSQDRQPIMLGTGTQLQWERLCQALDLAHLPADSRFRTNRRRIEYREALVPLLAEAFARFPARKLWQLAEQYNITLAPVNNLEQVFATPVAQALILEEKETDGTTSKRVKTAVFRITDPAN